MKSEFTPNDGLMADRRWAAFPSAIATVFGAKSTVYANSFQPALAYGNPVVTSSHRPLLGHRSLVSLSFIIIMIIFRLIIDIFISVGI